MRRLFSATSRCVSGPANVSGWFGRSGSGKTTIVKLLHRLYDIQEGRILIDGQDIAAVTQMSLRSQLALVPQEPLLFHRSLAENIAYGRPDASPREIEAAALLANANEFVSRQPKGYATLVGERGVKLSGGERQRVALARAFLANAPILILDEATSSLDAESEAAIQDATGRLMAGRTAIVIAHRLSTVRFSTAFWCSITAGSWKKEHTNRSCINREALTGGCSKNKRSDLLLTPGRNCGRSTIKRERPGICWRFRATTL